MKYILLLGFSCFLLFSCEKDLTSDDNWTYLTDYGGKWNTNSVIWKDAWEGDQELFGTDNYLSGYLRFEFTGNGQGNITYFFDYFEEGDHGGLEYKSIERETRFAVNEGRFEMEQNIGFGDRALFELQEPAEFTFENLDFLFSFKREM